MLQKTFFLLIDYTRHRSRTAELPQGDGRSTSTPTFVGATKHLKKAQEIIFAILRLMTVLVGTNHSLSILSITLKMN